MSKKLDTRSVIAMRTAAKKKLAEAKGRSPSFTQCHNEYLGKPFDWEVANETGVHPADHADDIVRALYFGFRFGLGLNGGDVLIKKFDEITKEYNESLKKLRDDLVLALEARND